MQQEEAFLKPEEENTSGTSEDEVDTKTGATPGVAAACEEYGMTDPDTVQQKLGIKPPGEL